MTKKKIRVGILFGGKSAEHEVSLQSAKNVVDAIDKDKYDTVLVGIDKEGKWLLNTTSQFLLNSDNPKLIKLNQASDNVALVPQHSGEIVNLTTQEKGGAIDVVFPILHGPYGEDGTVQGLLKLAGVPFVGASVLGSAVGMDKDVMKRLLRDADIPIGKFIVLKDADEKISFDAVSKELGLPFFVKPANMGSSVGVGKVTEDGDFDKAVEDAFQYDRKIIFEQYIEGRELECSVLGNDDPTASAVGEVVSNHEFYSYEAKYIDEHGAVLDIPAKIPEDTREKVRKLAVKAFKVLSCEGLGRVDFFLKDNGDVVVNEINTIPGFTAISMYPKLWQATGLSYPKLLDKLIKLALERHQDRSQAPQRQGMNFAPYGYPKNPPKNGGGEAA